MPGTVTSRTAAPDRIVGIGGSSGSFEAIRSLLEELDINTGLAFVFVPHLPPDYPTDPAVRLRAWTRMPVEIAVQGMRPLADHVYVIAPNHDLALRAGAFQSTLPRTFDKRHHQVDIFLKSLADALGSKAVSVILSGGDGDGVEGTQLIKKYGGLTFAQDDSASVTGMPRRARQTGAVDFVLTPRQIAAELSALGRLRERPRSRAGKQPKGRTRRNLSTPTATIIAL